MTGMVRSSSTASGGVVLTIARAISTVDGRTDVVPEAADDVTEDVEQVRLVIDDQDPAGRLQAPSITRAARLSTGVE